MRVYGYVRVSSKEQNVSRQIEELKKYNKDIVIFQDKISGKDFDRPEYEILKRVVQSGDIIVVKEMDRLGRNKQAILEELKYYSNHNIRVVILDIPTTMTDISKMNDGMAKEIIKMINNILIEVLSTMAEQERYKIRQRQREGLKLAKEKGVILGRPAAEYPSNWNEIYTRWKEKKITAVRAMDLLGLKKSTFYRLVKKYEK